MKKVEMKAIGLIREGKILLRKEYQKGLKFLSEFSHCIIIYRIEEEKEIKIAQKVILMNKVEELQGIIESKDLNSISEECILYDIKPYFPSEDRVLNSKVKKELAVRNGFITVEGNKVKMSGLILKEVGEYVLQLNEEASELLTVAETCSHLKIFWWFHKFEKDTYRKASVTKPPYEKAPKTGVFATRSPVRPNPIALSTAEILSVDFKRKRIYITELDCFDKTPFLSIVPYVANDDKVDDAKVPSWLAHWPTHLKFKAENILQVENIRNKHNIYSYMKAEKKIERTHLCQKEEIKVFDSICVQGARQNNLKNISVNIPHQKMTAITGVSGSGKSSLAFDTIYAESQFRFLEGTAFIDQSSLNNLSKPQYDRIDGLPPAIALAQNNVARNPRSTVATASGISEYIRTIFTMIGQRYCPMCGKEVNVLSVDKMIVFLSKLKETVEFKLSPFKKEEIFTHYKIPEENELSFYESLRNDLISMLKLGNGAVRIEIGKDAIVFQEKQMCFHCEHIMFELTPAIFNYSSEEHYCSICKGLGHIKKIDVDAIVTDPKKSLLDGASPFWQDLRKFMKQPTANWMKGELFGLANYHGVDLEKTWEELPKDFKNQAMYGSKGIEVTFSYTNVKNGRSGEITRPVEGAYHILCRLYEGANDKNRQQIERQFMNSKACYGCHGERLSNEGRLVSVHQKRFPEVMAMNLLQLKEWIDVLMQELNELEYKLVENTLRALSQKILDYLEAGLTYLNLDRSVTSLSGGEYQRLRLVSQLNNGITNLLYIFDEPTAGLHPNDSIKIIRLIKKLKDRGNTVILVEHNKKAIMACDYIIDIGPVAGHKGGYLIADGTPSQIKESGSLTGKYLAEETTNLSDEKIILDDKWWMTIENIQMRNLKNITLKFPSKAIVCICGVSGSGKSTLVNEVLYPMLVSKQDKGRHAAITQGSKLFTDIIRVNQSPIGKNSRSTPATYTGMMDDIRKCFAESNDAIYYEFDASRFSFNNHEGQCRSCLGEGIIKANTKIALHNAIKCPDCKGKRFNIETLQAHYKGKDIAEVLDMDIETALKFFEDHPRLNRILKVLNDIGLGYLKLGQSSKTLSGGEAQRIKLATELSKATKTDTLYLLDEPSSGLHEHDIHNLYRILKKLTEEGNTVLIIEHHPLMICTSDWIIELGPEGGPNGGHIISEGISSSIKNDPNSLIGTSF